MKTKLLRKLRNRYSSDFIIKECQDSTYKYRVISNYTIPYCTNSFENAQAHIREFVNKRIQLYVDNKRGRNKYYDMFGNRV